MFTDILATFSKFFVVFFLFIIAFALSCYTVNSNTIYSFQFISIRRTIYMKSCLLRIKYNNWEKQINNWTDKTIIIVACWLSLRKKIVERNCCQNATCYQLYGAIPWRSFARLMGMRYWIVHLVYVQFVENVSFDTIFIVHQAVFICSWM